MIDGPIQRENLYDMDNKNKQDPNMKSNWQTITMLLIAALLTFGLVSWMNSYLNSKKRQELSYNEFVKMVDGGEVESIKIGGTEITVVPKKDNAKYSQDLDYYVVKVPGDYKFVDRFLENNVETHQENKDANTLLLVLLNYAVPFLFLLFLMNFTMKRMGGGGIMGVGKSNAKMYVQKETGVTFKDVAGEDEAKESLTEIVDFLHNPGKYTKIGAKLPKGALLVGPPGTGKTLLARAVAGETARRVREMDPGCSKGRTAFIALAATDLLAGGLSTGADRVRDLFLQAQKAEAASVVIFIDELDAVAKARGARGGADEVLIALLACMDGFSGNQNLFVLGATNRPEILDPALLRPGRFDRQIVVDAPDVKGREKILQVHSKDKPIGSDVDLSKVAKLTPGFTGADLANLMNESALLTARRGKKIITQQEVSESMERVIAGPERKGRVLDEQTKHTIAYHESGHALVGHLLPHADPVHKISIISRGRALGYTLSIPKEDKVLNSLGEMRDELAVFMGGRVAEEIFCDDITTGASNDLERATKMARAIVTQYGMSAELGTQVFGQPNHEVFLGRDYGNTQDYSEETAKRIDDEVARIMKDAHDRAYEILASHREQMDLMANVLLERETVEGEACLALLDNTWDEYLKHEDEINARKEAEEAAARARDEHLADPNWKEEPVEPGDQDPNPPYREPAEGDGDDAPASASSTSDEAPVDAPAPQAPEQKGDGTER